MNDVAIQTDVILSKSERALQKRIDKLDAVGLTDDKLFNKVLAGLEAGDEYEEIIDGERHLKVKPNHVIQQKYVETALKMKNHLVPVEIKTEVNVDNRKNLINITPADGERLLALAVVLERLNSRMEMGVGQTGEVIDVPSTVVS